MKWCRRSIPPLFALVAASLLAGCGGKASDSPAERHPVHPQVYEGSFVEALDQIYAQPYVSACDTDRKNRAYELARDLDARKTEIDQFLANANPPGFVRKRHGDFVVFESLPSSIPVVDAWIEEILAWDQNFSTHDRLRNGDSIEAWSELRTSFGASIADDLPRVKWGSGYSTRHTDLNLLVSIRDVYYTCLINESCREPVLDTASQAWIDRQPDYRKRVAKIHSEPDLNLARKHLDKFYDFLEDDLEFHFGFRMNASITKIDSTNVRLPIWTFEFRGITAEIAAYVESVWKSAGFNLRIDWETSGGGNVFKLLLGKGPTGRAFVSSSRKEINLFTNVRTKTIAHEFGHVLGLPDRYYTVWDEAACHYKYQFNRADIMSNSRTGVVREADFEQLKRTYLKP